MPRAPRIDVGNEIYHVINRGNGRNAIFHKKEDYRHFEALLSEASKRSNMRIFAYVLMPNHWHLVLYPRNDGDLSLFMQWLTLTHTQQYRVHTQTIGDGHLYQGRYKSFLVQNDRYLLGLIRYVERNPLRAKLVGRAESWQWGSAYRRKYGNQKEKSLLSELPIELPHGYTSWLNEREDPKVLTVLRESVNKGKPYGAIGWVEKMVKKHKIFSTMRTRGRPRLLKKGT